MRASLFYGVFALLVGTNVATGVGLLMSPDIAVLMEGKDNTVLEAYEERIAQLRVDVDRLHSRQIAQSGDINLQMQELAQQQDVLSEQHLYVKALSERASELGINLAASPEADAGTEPLALTGNPKDDLAMTARALDTMMSETRTAMTALSEAAVKSTDEILSQLDAIGIRPRLPASDEGVGGPLLPPIGAADAESILVDANEVMAALSRFKAARGALDAAPIHLPVASQRRISSNFGNRKDPFTGRAAFHAGIDFPNPSGTTVLSAGAGKVTFVGQKSGYGNVVEVTHGNKLVTRYAHLLSFLVKEGQVVETGAPIAKVGSTGRSTGPHLHFEIRRGDKALNPMQFIQAGRKLQRYLAGV